MVDKPLSPEISRLTLLLESKPESRLFVPLAEAYIQSDMHDEAIRVLSDGIQNHQSFVAARVMLGKIYLVKKDFSEAKIQFDHVLDVAPSNIPSLKGLAAIYQEGGLIQQARESYQTILKIDPSDRSAEDLLATIDLENVPLPDQGISELTVLEDGPLPQALDTQVSEPISEEPPLEQEGQTENSATDNLELSVQEGGKGASKEKEPMATRTLASLYMKQGCYQEAAEIYEKLLHNKPSDLESNKRLEEAREHLRDAADLSLPKENFLAKEKKILRLQSWLNTIQREGKR